AEDPGERVLLLTSAADAAIEAGQLSRAQTLAERALPCAHLPSTRLTLVRVLATAAVSRGRLHEAHALQLAEAAGRSDPREAVTVMMDALHTTWFAGDSRLAATAAAQLDLLALPGDDPAWPVLQLQRWLTALSLDADTERLPDLATVLARAAESLADEPRDLLTTSGIALMGGLDRQALELATRVAADVRAQGRAGVLPSALYYVTLSQTSLGHYRDAMTSATEALDIAEATGQHHWASHAAGTRAYLLAMRGDEDDCRRMADYALAYEGGGVHRARWALGLLELGHGRPQEALDQLMPLYHGIARHQMPAERCLPDVIEAAVRLGRPDLAAEALARFEHVARRAPEPAIAALLHRCRALLDPDDHAFGRAATLHEQDSRGFEHARTRLLHGEWLRRTRRKAEAREQLSAALETFDHIDAGPWARRAHSELIASGAAAATRRKPGVLALLTPQELQIVTLAADGLSNRDIAAQLFLSPRTVGHHLYRAYPKLGVGSRRELAAVVRAAP
ncbi:LuxR C-terminal-related transcriptional regulator, partial [Amycolatopsis sp. SID8362]|uniref:LuxR C-terminal-related transcriptional regulator n=1 Tax=Amycolatopsis sp. SID8362 TaxID=2690346 RepID=UPI0013682CBC